MSPSRGSDVLTTKYMRNFEKALESVGVRDTEQDKFIRHYARNVESSNNGVHISPRETVSKALVTSVPRSTPCVVKLSDRNLLCMSVRGDEVTVGSADHGLKTVSARSANPQVIRTLYSKKCGHSDWVTTVNHLSDGRVISGGMDSKICAWRGSTCTTLSDHAGSVSQIREVDTHHFMSSSYDRSLKVWNSKSLRMVSSLHGHGAAILDFIIPQPGTVASAGRDGSMYIWDLSSGRAVQKHSSHMGPISGITCVDTNVIITVGIDGSLVKTDMREKGINMSSNVLAGAPVSNIARQEESSLIAITSSSGSVGVIDYRRSCNPCAQWSEGDINCVYSLAWIEEDGLCIGSGDGHLITRSGAGVLKSKMKVDMNAIRGIDITGSGKLVVITDDGNFMQFN